MEPSSLVPLIALLPQEWRTTVLAFLAFLGSMTVIVTALKALVPLLDKAAQRTGTKWDNAAVIRLSVALGWAATFAEWCQSLFELLGGHKLPGKGKAPAALLLLVCLPNQACAGQDALRTHSQIANAAYDPIMAAKELLEQRAADQVAEIRAHASGAEAAAKVATLRESYGPVEGAMSALIAAYNAYVDAIQEAHATGKPLPQETALALLSRWASLTRAAALIGLDVPVPPDALLALGGVS
jgi:hypothetical protein